jgi:CBS domain-containing protein
MKIVEIEKLKRVKLQTIDPDKSVHEASRKLVQFNIGALPVCDAEGCLIGIVTERDILRATAKDGSDALTIKVAAIMTRQVVTCTDEEDVESMMEVMTERRIRHLPVLREGRLVNIISIGDLVKATLDESRQEIRYLRDYVAS